MNECDWTRETPPEGSETDTGTTPRTCAGAMHSTEMALVAVEPLRRAATPVMVPNEHVMPSEMPVPGTPPPLGVPPADESATSSMDAEEVSVPPPAATGNTTTAPPNTEATAGCTGSAAAASTASADTDSTRRSRPD